MKYSEFKRKVEDLGFEVIDFSEYHSLDDERGETAWVSKNFEAVIGTVDSIRLSPELRVKLFDILVEYARTPIHARRDEKKYSIYPLRTTNYKLVRYEAIFQECGYEDEDSFGIDDSEFYNKSKTRVFNEHEAKEICDFFGWDFRKVAEEVDDDE